MKEYGLYINGEWRKSATGKTFVTQNPANGEVLAFFPRGTVEDVDQAGEAASQVSARTRKSQSAPVSLQRSPPVS